MKSPYWNVTIAGSSDATVNGVPVEMVVPTNVYSSVFQHLAAVARQAGRPVLARGVDETKGGRVAWFTVDANGQALAASPASVTPGGHHLPGAAGRASAVGPVGSAAAGSDAQGALAAGAAGRALAVDLDERERSSGIAAGPAGATATVVAVRAAAEGGAPGRGSWGDVPVDGGPGESWAQPDAGASR